MKKLLLGILATLAIGQGMLAQSPKRELRSIWFTTYQCIDWPSRRGTTAAIQAQQKAELIDYLDKFEKRNFNGICFHVRALADAVYQSSYEPWSQFISGTRGVDPGWDPLAFAIEECHKRGIECYAWVNPFRQRRVENNFNTPQDKDLEERGWLLTYNTSSTYYTVLNPAIPEARQRSLDVCREIYTKYDVDGMLFDDYFYPNGIPESSAAPDWSDYQAYKAQAGASAMKFGDWRRENINIFMRDLYAQIANDRPDMRFGLSPAGVAYLGGAKYGIGKPAIGSSDWQYNDIYSDPIAWLADGSIDFISPQIYWFTDHSSAPYEPLCKWWSEVAAKFNRHFYSSQGSYRIGDGTKPNTESSWSDIARQIDLNRQYSENNAPGSIYFSAKYFDGPSCSGLGQYLENNSYQKKALVPLIDWKEHPTYSAPKNFKQNGSKLSWTKVQGARSNSIIRYTVYAVPENVSFDAAQASDGDGIDVKYLVDIVYGNEFQLPADAQNGYWYAVCVYDGYGYESIPATAGYPEGESEATTLIAPVKGAVASWVTDFSWKPISNAYFGLQISSNADFSDIVIEKSDITATSISIDLEPLTPQKVYYWRVLSHQTGKLVSFSNVETFTVPQVLQGTPTTLVSPADGANIENDVKLSWTAVEGATAYNVYVSKASDFSSFQFKQTVSADVTKYDFAASRIGLGKFYWRVETVAPHTAPAFSATRSFTVTRIDVGNSEAGYTIANDPAHYNAVNGITISNIWMRSIKEGFANIDFDATGQLNRGMVIKDGFVYVSGRSEAAQNADIYLARYSLATGERYPDLELSETGKCPYYPCNDVIKDTKGNVLIVNLSLTSTRQVIIHKVNLENGELTQVVSIPCDDRVDHACVYGDVDSPSFYVMAAGASTANIYRWRIDNGSVAETIKNSAKGFYPAKSTGFGVAPRIWPASETLAYVDGSSTNWSLYDVTNGQLVTSFSDNYDIAPVSTSGNGGCTFTIGDNHYTVFLCNDYTNQEIGHRYCVASGRGADGFDTLSALWQLPEEGIGAINSSTMSAPADAVDNGNGTATLVLYVPGNGIAAYTITADPSGVDNILGATGSWSVIGRTVNFGTQVARVQVYTMSGALIADEAEVSAVQLPAAGAYIVSTPENSQVVTVK